MRGSLAYYKKIFSEIDAGNLAPLYLLQGSEPYIMDEMARRISNITVTDDMRSFNLLVEYATEVDINVFITTAISFPFLSDRRVLVLREIERLRGGWKQLIEYCKDPVSSSVVIMLRSTHDAYGRKLSAPRNLNALVSAVRSRGTLVEFHKLPENEVHRWVKQKAKRLGMSLDAGVAEALVNSVGDNLFELQNELDKLSLVYDEKPLGRSELERVIGSYRLSAIHDLIDSLRPGNELGVAKLIKRIISSGAEKPSVILYHLIRHFLSLLRVKAGYGGSDYAYKRMKSQADLFSVREIIVWLENLRTTDLLIKSITFPEDLLITGACMHSLRGKLIEARAKTSPAA